MKTASHAHHFHALLCAAIGMLFLVPCGAGQGPAQLYASACAACHGIDGSGRGPDELGFDIEVPDFKECTFATREPDGDWFAIIHQGGPVRAFDRMMPAFGEALTADEIEQILAHVHGFCTDDRWPRGDLNLPRALYTEKAFPEDEAVATVTVPEGGDKVTVELLYEKRFGPRTQIEVSLPLISLDQAGQPGRAFRQGDLGVGVKQNLYHDLARGAIFSVGAEIILPTGDEGRGFGKGTTIIEPYLSYGKTLPNDSFLQVQALAEFASDSRVSDEIALRAALGRTWASGEHGFGRAWTPMIEALIFRDLESGAETHVDLVPQFQVTLNTRQHVMLNAGLRIPVSHTEGRDVQFGLYVLWDWFDGGLTDGW